MNLSTLHSLGAKTGGACSTRIVNIALVLLLIASVGLLSGCDREAKEIFGKAERLWLHEQYDESVLKLHLLIEQYPSSPFASKALLRIGEIQYLNLNKPKLALDYFIRVTERDTPDDIKLTAREYIADIYENALHNYDLAILQYQEIIHEHQGQVSEAKYFYQVANAYFRKGDYAQASIEYHSLLVKFPNSELKLDILYQVANCKFVTGASKEAIKRFERLLKDHPGNKYEYDIWLGIAISYEELAQLKKALVVYKKMEKIYPKKVVIKRKIDSIKTRLEKKLK